MEIAIAQAGGEGFVVLAHIFIGGSRQRAALREDRLGTGREDSVWPEWLQRTPRRPVGLRGVICSALAGGRDPARKDLGCGFLGWFLFPQLQFLKKRAVTFGFGAVKVVEKAASAADHGEEAAAGSEVFYSVF